jgi:hypothetical protein
MIEKDLYWHKNYARFPNKKNAFGWEAIRMQTFAILMYFLNYQIDFLNTSENNVVAIIPLVFTKFQQSCHYLLSNCGI